MLSQITVGAVEQMARTLAKDLGKRGITVNTVSPGPIDTALFREGKPEQALKMIASMHPAQRLGQPEDVAPVVAMLASPEARWINGQIIPVNGVSH
jgi:3-oxoacyl-[acyl-carrier protein] reductase